MPVLRRAMPVLRRLKGWNAFIMHGTALNPAAEPHWSGLPWDDPIRCEVCGGDKLTRDMDKTWTDRRTGKRGGCSECGGSRDSDIVDNIMYYPTKKPAAKKPATKTEKAQKVKEARKKVHRPPTMKAKKAPKNNTKAVKTKEATRLSAK